MSTFELVALSVSIAFGLAAGVMAARYCRLRLREADELAAQGWERAGWDFVAGPLMRPPVEWLGQEIPHGLPSRQLECYGIESEEPR